jgi:hypothetical protein
MLVPQLRAATIEGRIIHPKRPEAAAGLEVVAAGFHGADGKIEHKTRTDGNGRFRLSDLPHPAAYLLTTSYDGISFPGGSVVFRKEDPDEPKQVTFHVYERTEDPSNAHLKRVRFTVEREAGTYRVLQDLVLANTGLEVIALEEAQPPALTVGLATGHGELKTSLGKLGGGPRVTGDTLELRGPIFPGEQEIRFFYDLAGTEADLAAEIGFPDAMEFVEVYVKDFGIKVDPGPLHPSRSSRNGDVIYQHYVGFDLPAGTRVPLKVQALRPQPTPQGWLQALILGLIGIGIAFYVVRPAGEPAAASATTAIEVEPEKEALVAALRDLEHDFETGKLSVEDRDRLRRDLKREALKSMAHPQAGKPSSAPGTCRCGNVPSAGDRFCSACGSAL